MSQMVPVFDDWIPRHEGEELPLGESKGVGDFGRVVLAVWKNIVWQAQVAYRGPYRGYYDWQLSPIGSDFGPIQIVSESSDPPLIRAWREFPKELLTIPEWARWP